MYDIWYAIRDNVKFDDTNSKKKSDTKFEGLQDRLPNLPILGWLSMKNLTSDEQQGCSQYPDILNIEFRNKYWQIFKTYDSNNNREATYHLYGAYLGKIQTINNKAIIIFIHRQ